MKVVKLTQKMLRMFPDELMVEFGAANLELKLTYPEHVYFSKKDYDRLVKKVRELAKKQNPGVSKNMIENIVGYEMLNFGPNETLANIIKPGYAVVDVEAIEREKSSCGRAQNME